MTSEPSPSLDPESQAESHLRPRRNAVGEDRPAFLLDFPDDPELETLIRAFEAGDFKAVRAQAPELAARTPDAKVRAAALELKRRTDPDPLLVTLLATCIGLFFFLVIWVYVH
jgi:hypothetical protein